MLRNWIAAGLFGLSAGVVVVVFASSGAHAEGTSVVCTQVPQGLPGRPGQIDDAFVANFMSQQLVAGRAHFESVTGVSTVLCAW